MDLTSSYLRFCIFVSFFLTAGTKNIKTPLHDDSNKEKYKNIDNYIYFKILLKGMNSKSKN